MNLFTKQIHGYRNQIYDYQRGKVSVCSVVQLYLTLCDPLDCSPPSFSVHGIFQVRIVQWVAFLPPGIFPTQGSNPRLLHLLHCKQILYLLSHQGSPNRKWDRDKFGILNKNVHTQKTDNQQKSFVTHRKLYTISCIITYNGKTLYVSIYRYN